LRAVDSTARQVRRISVARQRHPGAFRGVRTKRWCKSRQRKNPAINTT
jgi:hypothetical protein